MGRLFVANITRQIKRFTYRLDFNAQGQQNPGLNALLKHQDINPGRQVALGGDLAPQQIAEIIPQLERAGGLSVQDAPRQRGYVHFLYSLDRSVPEEAIRKAHAANIGQKVDEGHQRRQQAALAANQALISKLEQAPPELELSAPDEVTVEMEQLEVSEADEKSIAEGYRVRQDAGPAPQPPARGRSRKLAA